MHDHELTASETRTKVVPFIRNGERSNCVGEDQHDFGGVEQANIGTSKMDNGIHSNDGQEMDQEWNQVFAMMEQVELARNVNDFVVKPSLKRIPPGKLVCSKTPPNLTNQSETETVRITMCNCLLKDTTKSYNHSSKSCANSTKNYNQSERKVYRSETEKSRAQDLSFGCIDSMLLKNITQSYYRLSESCNSGKLCKYWVGA